MRRRDLTKKQQNFVKEYLESFEPKEAAIRAGYGKENAAATGVRLLTTPLVIEALQKSVQNLVDQKQQMEKEITGYLSGVLHAEENAGGKEVSTRERLKAAELLGKNLGLFQTEEKKDTTKLVKIIDDIR